MKSARSAGRVERLVISRLESTILLCPTANPRTQSRLRNAFAQRTWSNLWWERDIRRLYVAQTVAQKTASQRRHIQPMSTTSALGWKKEEKRMLQTLHENGDVKQARDVEELLRICQAPEGQWSAERTAQGFHRLKGLRREQRTLSGQQREAFGEVLRILDGQAMEFMRDFNPRHIGMLLNAHAAMLTKLDVTLFEKLVDSATAKMQDFDSRLISNFMWACAKLGMQPPEELFSKMCSRAGAVVQDFGPHEVVNLMWAYATLRKRPPEDLFNKMWSRAGALAEVFKPQHVETLMWAYAKLGMRPKEALSKLVPLQADHGGLDVLYEDEGLLAVSKPSGMAMAPPHRFSSGTLVNRIIGYQGVAPYVLHRLDMWTSGLVLFAKQKSYVQELSRQFRDREVQKVYLCIVDGAMGDEISSFNIDAAIGDYPNRGLLRLINGEGAKAAFTRFEVLSVSKDRRHSLLMVFPYTGRTHQIRLHAKFAGLPIMGDNVYGQEASLYDTYQDLMEGGSRKELRYLDDSTESRLRVPMKLHALHLTITHPRSGQAHKIFAPTPKHFTEAIDHFGLEFDSLRWSKR